MSHIVWRTVSLFWWQFKCTAEIFKTCDVRSHVNRTIKSDIILFKHNHQQTISLVQNLTVTPYLIVQALRRKTDMIVHAIDLWLYALQNFKLNFWRPYLSAHEKNVHVRRKILIAEKIWPWKFEYKTLMIWILKLKSLLLWLTVEIRRDC